MTTAQDNTRASGHEGGDETTNDPDDSQPWVQESDAGGADVDAGILGGMIDPRVDEGAMFALRALAVTDPDTVPVMMSAELDGTEIATSIDLTQSKPRRSRLSSSSKPKRRASETSGSAASDAVEAGFFRLLSTLPPGSTPRDRRLAPASAPDATI